jgi:phosphoadenosine phosphosulfate reductase
MIAQTTPKLPVIWVDSGYNVADTYRVADTLTQQLQLNLHVYSPAMTAERRNAIRGGIPTLDEAERHAAVSREVNLEPFERALAEHKTKVWISGIRREETEYRKSLDIVSVDARGILKIAPLFYWNEQRIQHYMRDHSIPSCSNYFDPTKVLSGLECGLHTAA